MDKSPVAQKGTCFLKVAGQKNRKNWSNCQNIFKLQVGLNVGKLLGHADVQRKFPKKLSTIKCVFKTFKVERNEQETDSHQQRQLLVAILA